MKFKGPNTKFIQITAEEIDRDIELQKKIKQRELNNPGEFERMLFDFIQDLDIEEVLTEIEEK